MNKILTIGICASIFTFILGCENQVKNTAGKCNANYKVQKQNGDSTYEPN